VGAAVAGEVEDLHGVCAAARHPTGSILGVGRRKGAGVIVAN
jgi:hypothetical protein